MIPPARFPTAALLSLSTLPLALAQGCLNTAFLAPNATGALPLAGFQPPEIGLNSTYTLSTALVAQAFPANNSGVILQTFFLTSTPFVDLSAPSLPLTGCVLALAEAGSPRSTDADGVGPGTCAGVLSADCQTALVEQVNNASLANSGSGPSTMAVCAEYLATMPAQCGDALSIVAVAAPLGNAPALSNSNCLDYPSLGNGSATQASLIETESAPYSPASDTATYDVWVKQATPLVITAWLKNGTGPESWADTRLVCSTPDEVAKGSQVVSGCGRTVGAWGGKGVVVVVLGIMLGWGVLL
ncbi:hypothetical protein MMC17_000827 [Xylographa soralifera]|nr:hypothetical protein [Xylographa soralifera]